MCSDRNDDESFDSVNVVADATLASQCIYSWIALTCYQLDSLLLIFQFFIVSKTMKEDDITNFIIHWTWYLEMIGFFVSFFSFLPYVAVILCRFLFDNVSLFCRSISCSQLDYSNPKYNIPRLWCFTRSWWKLYSKCIFLFPHRHCVDYKRGVVANWFEENL